MVEQQILEVLQVLQVEIVEAQGALERQKTVLEVETAVEETKAVQKSYCLRLVESEEDC